MSGTPTTVPSSPRARPPWPVIAAIGAVVIAIGLTLALPGGWRHARTVFGGREDVPALPRPPHEVHGLIELRNQDLGVTRMTADEYERYCNKQVLFLKTREVLEAALADPAVASCETVKTAPDPLALLRETVRAQLAMPGVIAVSMAGERVDDLKAIVNAVMRSYVTQLDAAERREKQDMMKKLEQLEQVVMAEADALERQIKLMARANSSTGSAETDPTLPRLREVERKRNQLLDDLHTHESELAVLEKRLGTVRLTEQSVADLRAAGVPEALLAKLKPLVDRDTSGRRAFIQELGKVLTPDVVERQAGSIFNAAHLPTVQLPVVPEEAVAKAIQADQSVAALTKERDAAAQLYEQVKKNAADPTTNQEVARRQLKLKQVNEELEARRQVVRKQAIVSFQAAEIHNWRLHVNELEIAIAVARERRRLYQEELIQLNKQLASEAEGRAATAQMKEAVAGLRLQLHKVREQLDPLRLEAKVDPQPRVRQTAQE